MKLFIIIVEWKNNLIPDVSILEDVLYKNFKYEKLTETSYMVLCDNTTVEVRNYIVNSIKNIERVFVGELANTAAWRNLIADNNIIKEFYDSKQ